MQSECRPRRGACIDGSIRTEGILLHPGAWGGRGGQVADDEIAVEWFSTSLGAEVLDAALSRDLKAHRWFCRAASARRTRAEFERNEKSC